MTAQAVTLAGAPATGARLLPQLRGDLAMVADLIEPGSRVLDVGCGEGELLAHLARAKDVDGRGIELSQSGVNACVRHGLSVVEGDANNNLAAYPSESFDYVVLSQTLQATRNPRIVIEHLVRIGRRAIVSFPNFGHWKIRLHVLLTGRMPVTHLLNHDWYDTPNIHLCTVRDFVTLTGALGVAIEKSVTLDRAGRPFSLDPRGSLANLLAEQGLFMLSRSKG